MARKHYGKAILKTVIAGLLLIIMVIGLTYGSVLRAMDRAAEQYTKGDLPNSLKEYENVELRLRSLGALRLLPAADRRNLFLNQARLLYALNRYDDALERLDHESDFSGTNFNDGRFLLLKGEMSFRKTIKGFREAAKPDANVLEEGLHGAEDNLREALKLLPNDWEAKYNFEYVSYLRNLINQQTPETPMLLPNQKNETQQPTALPAELSP